MASLREKVEGPAAIRELVQAARNVAVRIEGDAARQAYAAGFGASEWRAMVSKTDYALIAALARFDEIRTGAAKPDAPPDDASNRSC